jgi:hypothetical protein
VTNFYELKLISILDQQLKRTNSFIRDNRVQRVISRQFNNKDYPLFDPSNGDNICESRILLLDIFRQNKSYDELTSDEKLVISICQILRLYQTPVLDEFGLEVKSVERPSLISYECDNKVSKFTISKFTVKQSPYDTVSMISHAMSLISARYVQKLASIAAPQLLSDLVIYNRDKNVQSKRLKFPSQRKCSPTILTIFNSLKVLNVPMIYKITRLESSVLSDTKEQIFTLQGVDFIAVKYVDEQLRCVDLESRKPDEPQFIFSAQSVFYRFGVKSSENLILSRIAEIGCIANFQDFISSLKQEFDSGIHNIPSLLAAVTVVGSINIDEKHRQDNYSSTLLKQLKEQVYLENDKFFSSSFTTKSGERSAESMPLQLCRGYINSLKNERRVAEELIAASPKTGWRIEDKFFRNMKGVIVPF